MSILFETNKLSQETPYNGGAGAIAPVAPLNPALGAANRTRGIQVEWLNHNNQGGNRASPQIFAIASPPNFQIHV